MRLRRRNFEPQGGEHMSAELVAHSFGVYLLTVCVFSKTEHEPQGGAHMSAELVAHKPHCSNHHLLQLFALVLCAPLPTRRKLRFHLCNSCICSLVFVVREPCVRSTSDCAVLLRSWRTKDGGIMRELPLSMRVPLVASNELAIVTKSIAFVSPPRTTDNFVKNCP